jgi:hypothetical protein
MLSEALDDILRVQHLLRELAAGPAEAEYDPAGARRVLEALEQEAHGLKLGTLDLSSVLPVGTSWRTHDEWTVGQVRAVAEQLAARSVWTPENLTARALATNEDEATRVRKTLEKIDQYASRLARLRSAPEPSTAEHLIRYESHLSRQLFQALHELQRLQAARGAEGPNPSAVDLSLGS